MAVTEKEFESILLYGKAYQMGMNKECSYIDWKSQSKKTDKIVPYIIEMFNEFWEQFPATSKFTYNGKKFDGERALRANKQVCLKLYNDAITESKDIKAQKHWAQQILKALKVQVENIKIESYKKGDNRMQYMSSIEVYLRQRKYEPFIGEEMPTIEKIQIHQNTLDM